MLPSDSPLEMTSSFLLWPTWSWRESTFCWGLRGVCYVGAEKTRVHEELILFLNERKIHAVNYDPLRVTVTRGHEDLLSS